MIEWLAVVAAIHLMMTAVGLIGSGFRSVTGDQADELFAFAANPFVALMIGVLATVLTQSFLTTTSITVGMAAGGLPREIAIPILLGANGAASVHDMYNILSVAIFLPLERAFGYLDYISS